MNRAIAPWLVVGLAVVVGSAATYVSCPGCIDRNRVNNNCEWTEETTFPIEAANAQHQAHLVSDAQLAEELAIRHADAEFGKRFGVEHHGGLIDNGAFRRECFARMLNAIGNSHGVTPTQIHIARGHRNGTFDLAVALLFLPIYSIAAILVTGRLSRRFSSDEPHVRFIATGMASIAVTVLGVQSFRLFGAMWEAVRVGNGHMTSMRAATYNRWTQQYTGADFVAALLLFWLIALTLTQPRTATEKFTL